MELAQIFILALSVVSVRMDYCYDGADLDKKALKMMKKFLHSPNPTPPPDSIPTRNSSSECPLDLFRLGASGSKENRSLSPWTYIIVEDPDYYPQAYTQAVCLCKGCIMSRNGEVIDNEDYNSVNVTASRVFIKRIKCQEGGYRLKPETREVNVGCTCVRPEVSG
ncbi:interleukin-17C [Poeciliopsis prolifica]|uniref:interleukin-17C n=1 Tax=Poeciliopsis prolifica TaxID=188132 RepID=UPI00241364F3|nr:interleukin-17C [Poeciliopsis prolifica]